MQQRISRIDQEWVIESKEEFMSLWKVSFSYLNLLSNKTQSKRAVAYREKVITQLSNPLIDDE